MSPFWRDLLIPGVPLAEKVVRPILVYIFLVVGLRLAGKRELAQLNPFDLVVLLTLSNTVQNAIIGDDNSVLGGLIGATTLLVANYMVVALAFRHRRFGEIVEGGPDVLITHGRINEDRLVDEKITREELEAAARKQGFSSLRDVDQAILYPGGTFCFIGRVPTADAIHHRQLMAELHRIHLELDRLRGHPPAPPGSAAPEPAPPSG
jgi:uncharacterized membrane protein YcaP (DUF421 family)